MPPSGSPPFRVALLIETSNRYARDLLHGIRDWIAAHERWSIRLAAPGRHPVTAEWLDGWRGDGVIARVDSDAIAAALRRKRLPVVDVSAERPSSEFPRISIDNRAVAEMAATHLLAKRLPHYAFCGDRRFLWSRERESEFRRILQRSGMGCADFRGAGRASGRADAAESKALVRWLKDLKKPVGVFAGYDRTAHQVIEACHQAGLVVPNDVAVLGVDDDELICEFCDPPLSSILPNARRTGYEAAGLLARLMSGNRSNVNVPLAVAPIRVVERRSTESDAVADKHVAAALSYIRAHACDGIDMSDVLRHVPVSRTLLERKFVRLAGATPHRLIKQRRLERVCQLLAESALPIAAIADVTGFESASYLSAAFRREFRETPRAYRARHRPTSPPTDV